MFGAVLGAIGGFLVGNADGPAEVPAYTAVGASVALFANGSLGMLATSARPPSEPLRRAGWVVLMAAPIVAGVLTALLLEACPLYVTGRRTGFCNYQQVDLLGGWVSGVIVVSLLDTWFVAGLLLMSAWQAQRSEDATDPKWRRLAAGAGRETHLPD
jgi:heme/copper-type cytochrome/quinol oxidase subunit 2